MTVKKANTEERILAAAAKLFALKGFDGTTTREIVKEAKASLSSMQNFFQTKENLYHTVMERTVAAFYQRSVDVFSEIDEVERQGYLDKNTAWALIIQLISNLVDWTFSDAYKYEKLLINREMLQPSEFFEYLPEDIYIIFAYFAKLFHAYAEDMDDFRSNALSFSVITTLFNYNNYTGALREVLKMNPDLPENKQKVKIYVKRYLLSSIRTELSMKEGEGGALWTNKRDGT